jgi:hypothetical protein
LTFLDFEINEEDAERVANALERALATYAYHRAITAMITATAMSARPLSTWAEGWTT